MRNIESMIIQLDRFFSREFLFRLKNKIGNNKRDKLTLDDYELKMEILFPPSTQSFYLNSSF